MLCSTRAREALSRSVADRSGRRILQRCGRFIDHGAHARPLLTRMGLFSPPPPYRLGETASASMGHAQGPTTSAMGV